MRLETERLTLRPQNEGDVGALMAALNEWEVTRYLTTVPFPYTDRDARDWIAGQQAPEPGNAVFAIDLPGHGMIGAVSTGDELGYWLDLRFHGKGYMTEACTAVLDWHFAALPGDVVRSGAHVGNEASLNVQRKLGFTDTGVRSMRFVRAQNREVEHVETALTRAGFDAARRSMD